MERNKVKEFIDTQMVRYILGNGWQDVNMEMDR